MTLTSTPAWQALLKHRDKFHAKGGFPVSCDSARLENFNIAMEGLRLNYAFQNATTETIDLLINLARQQKIEMWRDRLFKGDKINETENRAVLHTALRTKDTTPILVDHVDILPEIRATQNRMTAFIDDVRNGRWKGATHKPFKYVVNIGIGGSDLGPRLVVEALQSYATDLEVHFVANIDAYDIEHVLKKVDPAQTLFIIVSKTFTTEETLCNAHTARKWLSDKLGAEAVAKHFIAVSVNKSEVKKFGIPSDNMFPMWDWVGGRYSLWSAVGLSIALAIGNKHFQDLLEGAAALDKHFQTAPLASNMPVIHALLAIWNRNFMETTALAILPYSERLRDLPRYLQQLEMESNGKSVTRQGKAVDYKTAPVIFGECGTVGQHSFYQCLHQGSDIIPADFIGIAKDDLNKADHHHLLLANMIAQIGALHFGDKEAVHSQNIYEGRRPSNLIMLEKLNPYNLGALLALYEHKVFVEGIIWDINSFDQPGVELGKRMAKELEVGNEGQSAKIVAKFFGSLHSHS